MKTTTSKATETRTMHIAEDQAYDGAHYVSLTPAGSRDGRSVQCPTRGAAIRMFKRLAENEPKGAEVQVYPGRIGEIDQNLPIAWTTEVK